MAHNCIVVNLDRCTGCYSCEITCKMENDIALGEHWNKMLQRGPFGDYPNMTRYPLPTMCQQCADAPCVHVCPTGASYRDGNNVVLIDREKCIGCKYCMMACPYGVRDWNKASKTVSTATWTIRTPTCPRSWRSTMRRTFTSCRTWATTPARSTS